MALEELAMAESSAQMTTPSTRLRHKVEPEMDVATTVYACPSHYQNTATTDSKVVLQAG